jgi:predicted nuclease of restriction endonuclease-like RecB superfamily
MLSSELLLTRSRGPYVEPRYVDPGAAQYLDLAASLVEVFARHQGRSRGELHQALDHFEGDRTDYRVQRGLVKLLIDERCQFRIDAPLPPEELRRQVFALSREHHPIVAEPNLIYPVTRQHLLEQVALQHAVPVEAVDQALYADLPENHLLDAFAPPEPETLLHRYNLALAQALLLRCELLRLSVARNLPVRYKQLFKFIKFYRLIHAIQGDLDAGYEIHLDGPLSMFRLTQKYGFQMALFLPALLLCNKWKMSAAIVQPDGGRREFALDDQCGLVSHYRDQTLYDSLLEETFARRFEKVHTGWQLERETEIINLKETVMIPDFAFRHPDGRTALLEIVGFWRPEYLRRKLDKLRQAQRGDLIVAVSRDLNVSEEEFAGLPGGVLFFKSRIQPGEVLEELEKIPSSKDHALP